MSICNAKKYIKRIKNPYTLGHSDYKSEWTGYIRNKILKFRTFLLLHRSRISVEKAYFPPFIVP